MPFIYRSSANNRNPLLTVVYFKVEYKVDRSESTKTTISSIVNSDPTDNDVLAWAITGFLTPTMRLYLT
ncbi:hypothetical protein J6590_001652 [Homalodisca vitripennis]|nr:hypothetical protein J6590_001652 [Homalodisca vitripennis]